MRVTMFNNDKANRMLFLILTIFFSFIYVWAVSNETMPMAEGWYTYYAQCMQRGELPYRDFEFLFPPVYLYCIYFITKIFGYQIIVLRMFGVILYVLIAIGVYKCTDLIVCIEGRKNSWIAFVASIASVFYMQSENAQVFYDYVRLMDLFVIMIAYFILKYIKSVILKKENCYLLYGIGLLLALLILTKQNTGLIVLFYIICLLVFTLLYKNITGMELIKRVIKLIIPIMVVLSVVLFIMAFNGMLNPFIQSVGGGAISAKGGMTSIIFGWISNNDAAFKNELFASFIAICILVQLSHINNADSKADNKADLWISILFAVITFIMLIFAFRFEKFAKNNLFAFNISPYRIFLIVFCMFLGLGVKILLKFRKIDWNDNFQYLAFSFAGMYFAISFASGTCGGLANGQATLGIAFIISWTLFYLSQNKLVWMNIAEVLIISVFCIQTISLKLVNTYYWWGMETSSHWENNVKSAIPLFKGIYLSAEEEEIYEVIYNIVTEKTNANDTIYCFPNIPVVYSMCNRMDPGVKSKVQWFDVSTNSTLDNDILVIKEKMPKIIIMYNTPEAAYDAHEILFRNGEISGTRRMRDYLLEITNQEYECFGTFVDKANSVSVYIKK